MLTAEAWSVTCPLDGCQTCMAQPVEWRVDDPWVALQQRMIEHLTRGHGLNLAAAERATWFDAEWVRGECLEIEPISEDLPPWDLEAAVAMYHAGLGEGSIALRFADVSAKQARVELRAAGCHPRRAARNETRLHPQKRQKAVRLWQAGRGRKYIAAECGLSLCVTRRIIAEAKAGGVKRERTVREKLRARVVGVQLALPGVWS